MPAAPPIGPIDAQIMGLDSKQFLSKLQSDLASGKIEIAGFPDSVLKLLREMRDEFVSNSKLERIVREDAALSARIVSMANSAAFQSSAGPTTEAGSAIARIGLAALRTVVLAYGFSRLRDVKVYKLVQGRMGDIWLHSLAIATIGRALLGITQSRAVDRDALILGGMLSGVGKIYLLAEISHHEEKLNDFAAVEHMLETWHAKITRTLLKNWEFPESVIRAATTIDTARSPSANNQVADILYVADMFSRMRTEVEELTRRLQVSSPAMRLGVSAIDPQKVYTLAAEEAASISQALS